MSDATYDGILLGAGHNALVPRRFVRSPRSREALRTRYDTGAVPKVGH